MTTQTLINILKLLATGQALTGVALIVLGIAIFDLRKRLKKLEKYYD